MSDPSPCTDCGACCATYRVSFYWAEADDATPNGVPVAMTRKLTPHLRVMRGTEGKRPRCVALMGTIGDAVRCTIHPRRIEQGIGYRRDELPHQEDAEDRDGEGQDQEHTCTAVVAALTEWSI